MSNVKRAALLTSDTRIPKPAVDECKAGGISPAVTSEALTSYRMEVDAMEQLRIRRLTPRECWRLMDFSDEDFDKAKAVNSDSQLYKQAGNSIVVNVLVAIFGQMFDGKENEYNNTKRFREKDDTL